MQFAFTRKKLFLFLKIAQIVEKSIPHTLKSLLIILNHVLATWHIMCQKSIKLLNKFRKIIFTLHSDTLSQYHRIIEACKHIFEQKTSDYGTAWRILRLPSITDQIMIKAQRIRAIQEQKVQRVEDGIATELIGIINYSIMALMQPKLEGKMALEVSYMNLAPFYEEAVEATAQLVTNKNHDYQEAWRGMRLSSIVDIILMKLLRVKRIEDNGGNTLISEGVDANYQDIINYAVFALIKIDYDNP